MYARAANDRKLDLGSASKADILNALYQRFLRDLAKAHVAILERDDAGKAEALNHASRILAELRIALDFSVAPALCENLSALYEYVEDRLNTAEETLEVEPLSHAAEVILNLQDSFREANTPMSRRPSFLVPQAIEALRETLDPEMV